MSETQEQERAFFSSSGRIKEKETKIKAMGSSKISGGKIDKFVKISGSSRIEGTLECHGFKSLGSTTGKGSIVSYGDVKSSGSFSINGALYSSENVKFFGSAVIGENTEINGKFSAFGSFKAGSGIKTGLNFKVFGATSIDGDIIAQGDVKIKGGANVSGNISANNVILGRKRWWNIFSMKQGANRPYRIKGTILGNNTVDIRGTVVTEDVKGRRVRIRKYSRIEGQIYYVDSIRIHRKTKINSEPIQIKEEKRT